MSFAIHFTPVFEVASEDGLANAGAIVRTDGKLLAALNVGTYPYETKFYLSSNDGLSWSHLSTLPGILNQITNRIGKAHPDNLIFARYDSDNDETSIYHSTNSGASWSLVATYPFGSSPFQTIQAGAAISYNRESTLIGGLLIQQNDPGGGANFGWLTAGGTGWTDSPRRSLGGPSTTIRALTNLSSGRLLAGDNENKIWVSTDYGQTWSHLTTLPATATQQAADVCELAALTDDIIMCASRISSSSPETNAALYRSTDAGTTWSYIDPADILDYPGAASRSLFTSLHRLTRDAALLIYGTTAEIPAKPILASLDQGATWPIAATLDSYDNTREWEWNGGMCTTPGGSIITTSWSTEVGPLADGKSQIWRGRITC